MVTHTHPVAFDLQDYDLLLTLVDFCAIAVHHSTSARR
jgi:hypothetical protein